MRILIAHSFYRRPGGEDAHVRRQVELLRVGHDVGLLTLDNADLPGSLRTAAQMVYSSRRRREAEKAIVEFGPDVIHVHNVYPAWGPAIHLAADRTATPLVMTVHNLRLRCPNGVMFTQGEVCRRCEGGNTLQAIAHDCLSSRRQAAGYAASLWAHRFVLKLEQKVDLFIAPSHFMLERLRHWGIRNSILIPHGIRLPPIARRSENWGLYLGRLAPGKGVDVLLHALALAGDPPFRIAGDGPLLVQLEDLSRELRLENVEFVGHKKLPWDLLGACSYVVVPSLLEESFGLTVAEAMSFGKPVVVTRRGALPETAEDGRALAVEAGDVGSLAEAVTELNSNSALAESIGRRGRAWIEGELSEELHITRLEKAYSDLRGTTSS
jgi:glycosyltransferase involved in cell wall biosynthesis